MMQMLIVNNHDSSDPECIGQFDHPHVSTQSVDTGLGVLQGVVGSCQIQLCVCKQQAMFALPLLVPVEDWLL